MSSNEQMHVWIGSILNKGVPVKIKAFSDQRSARNWVESRVPVDARWSSDSDMQVVLAVEAVQFDDPPGRIDKVPVSNEHRFREKWAL